MNAGIETMNKSLKYMLIFLAVVLVSAANGKDCSFDFDFGENQVLDCGENYTLDATPGFDKGCIDQKE